MQDLLLFLKKAGLSPHSTLFTVTAALERAGEDELLDEVNEAMEDQGLNGSSRTSTLLTARQDEAEEDDADEEEDDDDDDDDDYDEEE